MEKIQCKNCYYFSYGYLEHDPNWCHLFDNQVDDIEDCTDCDEYIYIEN